MPSQAEPVPDCYPVQPLEECQCIGNDDDFALGKSLEGGLFKLSKRMMSVPMMMG